MDYFSLNLFILFLLVSWLPTVLSDAGWTRTQALRGSVMNQAGGVIGGLAIAWLIDSGRVMPAMLGGYVIAAIALSLFLVLPSTVPSWITLLLLVGAGVSGGQVALNAMSALFYPPSLRATGSGWAYMLGRIGALLAPFAGGFVLQRLDLEPVQQLSIIIVPVTSLRVLCRSALLRSTRREGRRGRSLDRLVDECLPGIGERKIDRHVLCEQHRHHFFFRVHDDPGRSRTSPAELAGRAKIGRTWADRPAR